MPTKKETLLYNRVNKHLPDWIYFEKNNNPYLSGPADAYYEGRGQIAWVEYKVLEAWPVRSTTTVSVAKLTSKKTWPRQKAWLGRAHGNGIPSAVFVGMPGKLVLVLDTPQLWNREWLREEMNLVEEHEAAAWIAISVRHVVQDLLRQEGTLSVARRD